MRYFRAEPAVYEQVRLTLDAAWGHPNEAAGTITCIEPSATAPHDAQGRAVVAVPDEFCAFSVAVDMLPQLLGSGAVEEIDAATYQASLPQNPV